jgi:hypothetical protein
MGHGSVSSDLLLPSGVRLMVVLLVVVWPVVSNMPIYDGILDIYVFYMLHVICYMLHVLYIGFLLLMFVSHLLTAIPLQANFSLFQF